MDANCCRQTREALQGDVDPLITKPRLTDALLERPPFRFLHDVVLAVQRATGFMARVLSAPELDSKAMAAADDREQKLAFLEKLIQAVSDANGAPVQVQPHKILAGLEPERTNALLQTLARVARLHKMCTEEQQMDLTAADRAQFLHYSDENASEEEILCLDEEGSEEVLSLGDGAEEMMCFETEKQPLSEIAPSRPQSSREEPPERRSRPKSARGQRSSASVTQDVEGLVYGNHEVPSEAEGALVRDLKRAMRMNLARQHEDVRNEPSAPRNISPISPALRDYFQLTTQLHRVIENLMDAAQPMQKEWVHWKKEATKCKEQLRQRQGAGSKAYPEKEKLRQIEKEVEEKQARIRRMKERVDQKQQVVMEMLESLT